MPSEDGRCPLPPLPEGEVGEQCVLPGASRVGVDGVALCDAVVALDGAAGSTEVGEAAVRVGAVPHPEERASGGKNVGAVVPAEVMELDADVGRGV